MADVDRRTLLKMLGAAGLGAGGLAGELLDPGAAGAAAAPPPSPPADALRTRLTEAYGIHYPIVQAGMAFYATPASASSVPFLRPRPGCGPRSGRPAG
jgi:hypothetical protein